jgi:hypothetical protein
MVGMAVGRDDAVQAVLADSGEKCLGRIGGVDQYLAPGATAAQQIGVVGAGADRQLLHYQLRQHLSVSPERCSPAFPEFALAPPL